MFVVFSPEGHVNEMRRCCCQRTTYSIAILVKQSGGG